jgi:hypothetical protein
MRRDLFIALLGLAAGVGAALLVLGSDREPSPAAASAALALLVGLAYIASGLIVRRQRPENRLGAVMIFIGFAWFVTFLADSDERHLFTLGTVLEDLYLLGFVYLVLSFPSGRLRSRLDVGLFAAAVAIATVFELAWLLFADSGSQICSDCPDNVLEVTRNDGLASGILQAQRTLGVVLSVFTAVFLIRRWRRASGGRVRPCCGREVQCSPPSRFRSSTTSSTTPSVRARRGFESWRSQPSR